MTRTQLFINPRRQGKRYLTDAMEARPGVLEGLAWGPEPSATWLDDVPTDAIRDAAKLARHTLHINRAEFLEAEYDRRAP